MAFFLFLSSATAHVMPVAPGPNYVLPTFGGSAPVARPFPGPSFGAPGAPGGYPQYGFAGGYPGGIPQYGFAGGTPQFGLLGGRSLLPPSYPAPGGMFGGGFGQPMPMMAGMGPGGPMMMGRPMMMGPQMMGPQMGSNGNGSIFPMLAMAAVPLLGKLFSGSGGPGGSDSTDIERPRSLSYRSPVADSDEVCESCRVRRSLVPRLAVRQPEPEEAHDRTEADVQAAPVPVSAPVYRVAGVSTSGGDRSDRVATSDGEGSPQPQQRLAPPAPVQRPAQRPAPAPAKPAVRRAPVRAASTAPRRPRGVDAPVRDTRTAQEVARVRGQNRDELNAQKAPVWNPFMKTLAVCAPGCVPTGYASYGSRGHRTCHSSGRALDVFGLRCGNTTYKAISSIQKFEGVAKCFRDHGMKVIYREKNKDVRKVGLTQAHYDHAHFSIKCYGGRVW